MGEATYYSDTTTFEIDVIEWEGDWTYVVEEDSYASDIFDEEMAFERVLIKSGATLFVDIPIYIRAIQIGVQEEDSSGHLRLVIVDDVDYSNPHISFEDAPDSGIHLEKGSFGTEVDNVFDHRFVLASSKESPNYNWSFYADHNGELSDLELVNPNPIELFNIDPGVIYQIDNSVNSYNFPRGFSDLMQGESWSIRHETLEKGRTTFSEFEHSEGEFWDVTLKLRRRDGGKRDIAFLKWLGSEAQRELPFIFFSSDILKYARMEDVDVPSDTNMTYQARLRFREVGRDYEKY